MKTFLHVPMDYAKKLKLRFRVEDLDLPERRNNFTSSREEEYVAIHMCPCGTIIESRTHIVGQCEKLKEGTGCVRGGDEDIRRMCGMEQFGRL